MRACVGLVGRLCRGEESRDGRHEVGFCMLRQEMPGGVCREAQTQRQADLACRMGLLQEASTIKGLRRALRQESHEQGVRGARLYLAQIMIT